MSPIYVAHERARAQAFEDIWSNDIDDVFSDVAKYYDRANIFASLGLLNWLREKFLATVACRPQQKVLDLCAGTNIIGMSLLERCPELEMYAADRSMAMQQVGRSFATQRGLQIRGLISDAHRLPFPDNHFDIVTLQWATRHLRVVEAFSEIKRVLKPGGVFYHCDMLRPANKLVEKAYYLYLKACVFIISSAFGSGTAALKCRRYFVDAIRMFYSTQQMSDILLELGYVGVVGTPVLGGTVAFHKACKE